MILFLLAYLGGVLTIVSPCVLPVLPFVFARAERPFTQGALPVLVGMAVTFALVASLAAVAGGWAVEANQYGRILALVLLALFGLTLISTRLADYLSRPLVAVGARLSESAGSEAGFAPSFLIGIATGLLWAPCAGPVLGIILTGAALHGASIGTTLALLAYAAGAATSLALALLIGGRVLAAMKRSLGVGEWVRRGLGVAVLAAVLVIAFGLDTGFLTNLSAANTASLEQGLLDRFQPGDDRASSDLAVEGTFPSLSGALTWLNSPPLTAEVLKGKVVLIDFWTYSCINCLRTIPYIRAWAEKYKDQGLVVIGVHTPEFAFEKNVDNVRTANAQLGVHYPVAIDSNYTVWRAFKNQYWPAFYFIDAQGNIRHHVFGEGEYGESERVIQKLLAEAGNKVSSDLVSIEATGVEVAPDDGNVNSPETYIGYREAENFVSPGGVVADAAHGYTAGEPRLNEWGLAGDWTVGSEHGTLGQPDGSIVYRFHARDLHLVLGPPPSGEPVRFRVTIDGAPPGDSHGTDTDAQGEGAVTQQRLYQLVRQSGAVSDHTFEIKFFDPGVQAFVFTFG
ncbi:MAG TPA: cytochrome c biogenesis protein DipZ [Aliidongia sp.]|nr:cytochrome c biogenesis protein DipZ [Aliidongia sp.]